MMRKYLKYLFLPIFFSIVAYVNTINNELIRDDHELIVANKHITNFSFLKTVFTSSLYAFRYKNPEESKNDCNYYRPMYTISYMIVYHFFKLDYREYHIINISYNTIATVLVFFVSLYFLKDCNLAGLVSILFTLHPTHTEVIGWLSCLPELIYTIFYLAAFLLFIKFGDTKKKLFLLFSSFLFLMALFSKETSLTFLPLILIYDLLYKKIDLKNLKEIFCRYLLFFIAFLFYSLMRIHSLGSFVPVSTRPEMPFSIGVVLFNGIFLFTKYLYTLALPFNLPHIYILHSIQSFTDIRFIVSFIIIVALFFSLIYLIKKGQIAIFLHIVWFVILLFPVLNINIPKIAFGNRYLYLPSLCFFIVIILIFKNYIYKFKRLSLFIITCIIISYLCSSLVRNRDFKNDFILYSKEVRHSPDSTQLKEIMVRDFTYLGNVYLDSGNTDNAIKFYEEALKSSPSDLECLHHLMLAYYKQDRCGLAITTLNRILNILSLAPERTDSCPVYKTDYIKASTFTDYKFNESIRFTLIKIDKQPVCDYFYFLLHSKIPLGIEHDKIYVFSNKKLYCVDNKSFNSLSMNTALITLGIEKSDYEWLEFQIPFHNKTFVALRTYQR